MPPRNQQIEQALARLEAFKSDPMYADKRYAIDANIVFLQAARSLPRYLWWLFTVAPKLDGSRLLELTDFTVEEWDVAMHSRLIEIQKHKWPGLIAPLVGAITEHLQKETRDLVMANFGAGGMEVDRQAARWALQTYYPHRLTIVAVDKSPVTRKIAAKNMRELANDVEIIETGEITAAELERLRKNTKKKTLIVMCTNNIFQLDEQFPPQYFDLIYHSLFKHHLNPAEQEKLDSTMQMLARKRFEFDGYKSWPVVVPQTIVGWEYPYFLNGTIISMARYQTNDEVKQKSGDISYYAMIAHYLRKF